MDFPKSVPNVGLVNGRFIDEDPSNDVVGSLIPAAWGNAVTLEMLSVIEGAGLIPDETDISQLLQAIRKIKQVSPVDYAPDIGTVNAYAAAYEPAVQRLEDGLILKFKARTDNTDASTFRPNDLAPAPIVDDSHVALQKGAIVARGEVWLQYNSTIGTGSWVMVMSSGVPKPIPGVHVGDIKTVATVNPPQGWLKCNGAAVSRAQYAALFEAIDIRYGAGNGSTTFNLPDLRGEFVRGWDDGREVDPGRLLGSHQDGQNAWHAHTTTSGAAGSHGHTGGTDAGGSHQHYAETVAAGNHQHPILKAASGNNTTGPYVSPANAGQDYAYTDAAGDHVHGVNVAYAGEHSHGVSVTAVDDHTHSVTVEASGGAEARPRNVALLYVIKY